MAIDRKAVAERLLSGSVTPASQLIAPVSFGYDPKILPTLSDPAKAKAIDRRRGV